MNPPDDSLYGLCGRKAILNDERAMSVDAWFLMRSRPSRLHFHSAWTVRLTPPSLKFCTHAAWAKLPSSAAVLFCQSTVAVFVHGGTTAATIRHPMPRFPAPFLLTLLGLVGHGNATEGVLPYLRTSVWFNVALRPTETTRLIRDGNSPGRPPQLPPQLLSSVSVCRNCPFKCHVVGALRKICIQFRFNIALRPQRPYRLLEAGSPGRPPRISHNS